MFPTATYLERRKKLAAAMGERSVLLCGNSALPRNYPDNTFPFRQNSHLLYFCGVDRPGVVLARTAGGDVLFGPPEDIDDVVWHGPHETLVDTARRAGIDDVRDVADLGGWLAEHGEDLAYLAPYQASVLDWFAGLMGRTPAQVRGGGSPDLARAICDQRSCKSAEEIAQIEEALSVTRDMHLAAMGAARPGVTEAEVCAVVQQVALEKDRAQSYNPIVTVRGEVLHNNDYSNTLEPGQLLLNDSGAESPLYYASDITRTFPVTGRFNDRQREIYDVVLRSQLGGIAAFRSGVLYREIHLTCARIIAEGLVSLGLMKGDPEAAVAAGAHALFFPHGVGHMLGLDVHDMEDLGDVVGYADGEGRSDQFGLNFLRLARPLESGYVVTVEPGIYFIPVLIDRWRADGRHADFIDYDVVETYRGFGGVRIEDDVLCADEGGRVLGPAIPKTVEEIEAAAS